MYLVPSKQVVIAAAGLLLLAAWGLTVALFTAPLSTYARDVRYSFNYVTQFWYFLTPIAYPISSIPPQYQPIAEANPLTAPVEMVKYGFLQTAPPTTKSIATCFIGLAVLGVLGLWLFTRMERAAVQRL
jgi:ABC-type polysaccharide/polyol phosphate export permease